MIGVTKGALELTLSDYGFGHRLDHISCDTLFASDISTTNEIYRLASREIKQLVAEGAAQTGFVMLRFLLHIIYR